MRSLFVMDPLDRIQVAGDSTYITMRECTARDYPVFACTPDKLFTRDGAVFAVARQVVTTAHAPFFLSGPPEDVALADFDVVWMRKDPPFDMRYVLATYLLDMVPPSVLVVNDPRGLKLFNEKLWVQARFAKYQPATLISNDRERLVAFVRAQSGRTVLKPWDGNGGRGVVVTDPQDRNLNSLIELLTQEGRDYCIAQAYLPGVAQGDKRILLFDGEPVGAVLRVPAAADHRANLHVGGQAVATDLTERELEICAELGPVLRETGMIFVGIDIIDGHLTEINVTSPTGIQEINRLNGVRLESVLVDCVLARLEERRS